MEATKQKSAWDGREIGCLWVKISKKDGKKFFSGKISTKNLPPDSDIEITVFTNKDKQGSQPDLRVYHSPPRENNPNWKPSAKPAIVPPVPVEADNSII